MLLPLADFLNRRSFDSGTPVIIDFHCHILPPGFSDRHRELLGRDRTYAALFPQPGARMATAASLLKAMTKSGIDHSVVLGFGWTDREVAREVNDYLIDSVMDYGDRLSGFCSVNPGWGAEALAEVERCAAAGLKGIGELHPDSQNFDITSRSMMAPIMELAQSLNLPVLVHTSEPVGHQYPGKGRTTPDRVYQFIKDFPRNTIICAHWGGGLPFYGLMPELSGELANVFFDTAASPFLYRKEVFEVAVKTTGADKILFGTDYPLIGHRNLLSQIEEVNIDEEVRSAILGGNAAALLGLVGQETTAQTADS